QRIRGLIVLAAAIAATVGCNRRETPTPVPQVDSAQTGSMAASGVAPHSGQLPASGSRTSPAEGATAIGGMSGRQEAGGARQGQAPAATAGDGGASAPAR